MSEDIKLLEGWRRSAIKQDEAVLVAALAQMQLARQIGRHKLQANEPLIPDSEGEQMRIQAARKWAQAHYLDPDFAEVVVSQVIAESQRQQELQFAEAGRKT